jgi:hypothetical protein
VFLYWFLGVLTVLCAAAIFMFFALAIVSAVMVVGAILLVWLLPGILAGWDEERKAENSNPKV